jgi:hypothetical protein
MIDMIQDRIYSIDIKLMVRWRSGSATLLHSEGRQFNPVTDYHTYAALAQLVEHLISNQDVGSSRLSSSTMCRHSSVGRAPDL